jgi:hypothetical protein
MQLACPKCGTREVRVSRRKGFLESVKGSFGIYPLRCRRCRHRWLTSVWAGGAWKFARCPRCYRQDLTTWSEQYYHPPKWVVFLLRMGATPYRCAACRCNFASFRPCKEKFSWRHEFKPESSVPAAAGAAPPVLTDSVAVRTPVMNGNEYGHAVTVRNGNGHTVPVPSSYRAHFPEPAPVAAAGEEDEYGEPFL